MEQSSLASYKYKEKLLYAITVFRVPVKVPKIKVVPYSFGLV